MSLQIPDDLMNKPFYYVDDTYMIERTVGDCYFISIRRCPGQYDFYCTIEITGRHIKMLKMFFGKMVSVKISISTITNLISNYKAKF